ncbi:terminase small subunit [Chitinophaga sp. 22536]|uniref:terminase small subunit n=1 Tax=unclassified Chitinophaga TaxID=2619133 RepID=UPI003F86FCFC
MGESKKRKVFQQNNQLWKLRSKHGREKLFASPELLSEAATEYFDYCDSTPILKEDYVGGFATRVLRELPRPYTVAGFCLYVGASRHWWNEFRKSCSTKKEHGDQIAADFLEVITCIEDMIYNQKFEGAAVGLFQQNLISRDLGLVDKKEVEQTVITVESQDDDDPELNEDDEL